MYQGEDECKNPLQTMETPDSREYFFDKGFARSNNDLSPDEGKRVQSEEGEYQVQELLDCNAINKSYPSAL